MVLVKNKKFIILLMQLGLMGAFVLGVYHFTQQELAPTNVYVYTKRLNKNAELEESDFRKIQIPAKAVDKSFLTDKDMQEIREGKMAMSTSVEAGQYAYKKQIQESSNIDPFDEINLAKYRKISLPVSYETAISGDIKRGDTVDLAYIGNVESTDSSVSGDGRYSNIFMQGVLVDSVTTKDGFEFVGHTQVRKSAISQGDSESGDTTDSSETYEGDIGIITLAVPIDKIEEILARSEMGKIRVVGRYEESIDSESPGYLIGINGQNPMFAGNKKVENSIG